MNDDESFVTGLLSDFGVLPKSLIISLMQKDSEEKSDRILRKLRNENRIVPLDSFYYAANRHCKTSSRLTMALWVVNEFVDSGRVTGILPGRMPVAVSFIKNTERYEVIVLESGGDYLLGELQINPDTKYIIAVPDSFDLSGFKNLYRFKGTKFIIAKVYCGNISAKPEITFLQAGG